jgi:hypothetical protein
MVISRLKETALKNNKDKIDKVNIDNNQFKNKGRNIEPYIPLNEVR